MKCGQRALLPVWIATVLLAPATTARAQTPPSPRLTVDADVRAAYLRQHREKRSGGSSEDDDWRARVRLGARFQSSEEVAFRVRLAGRFSSDQERMRFLLRDYASSVDGLRPGEITVDEAYLHLDPAGPWAVRVGRLQTKFVLADLTGKSLDRSDSPSNEVSWTDGVHVTFQPEPQSWTYHLIAQHNSGAGPTNALRPPLGFSESSSRFGFFAAADNTSPWGPVVQRTVDITYLPAALMVGGTPDGDIEEYVAIVARTALAWPVGGPRGHFLIAGEVGYAPNTPQRVALGLPDGDGDTGGLAFQLAATLADLIPGHRIGVVYGQADAGWLISPDFRNNDRLVEGRYQWAIADNHTFEANVRHRQDLIVPASAVQRRKDFDFFFRFTSRF